MVKGLINRLVLKNDIFSIDFNKSWLDPILKQKKLIFYTLAFSIPENIFKALFPLIVGWVISTKNYYFLIAMSGFYLSMEVLSWFTYHNWFTRLLVQTYDSFRYSAYKFFLLNDPINYSKYPSGIVLGKIQRTAYAFFDIVDELVDEVVSMLTEFTVVFVTMLYFNINLGLLSGFSMLLTAFSFSYLSNFFTSKLEIEANVADDSANRVGAESIHQFSFIRYTFSTLSIKNKIRNEHKVAMQDQYKVWMTHRMLRGFFIIVYILLATLIEAYLIHLIRADKMTVVWATTLLLTYIRGTKGVFSIDKRIKTILKSYRRIIDFYSFVDEIKHKTFPVLSTSKEVDFNKEGLISLSFENVTFGYNPLSPLFENNSFYVDVNQEQNKLFGIIGPSGIGKTTLISLLGGQIKPQKGTVSINGIEIYSVDDSIKKELIAIQGQSATGLYGTLKYNLKFGLSENYEVLDEELVQLLKNVGIWKIFEDKKGLETEIGESGFSLSGGQRQRLNFANLYLRAKCYKPLLILIDEPTSSLDEISEKAITDMIVELSKNSLTFVIAHRIKTLKDASKILDLSLLKPNSELLLYKPDDLYKVSQYYQELVEGKVKL